MGSVDTIKTSHNLVSRDADFNLNRDKEVFIFLMYSLYHLRLESRLIIDYVRPT